MSGDEFQAMEVWAEARDLDVTDPLTELAWLDEQYELRAESMMSAAGVD